MDYQEHDDGGYGDGGLQPCNACGRTFIPETLVKHERICSKSQNKPRKVFQSGRQRAQGSDIPVSKVIRSDAPPPKAQPSKKANWRAQHTDFINTIRAARGVQQAMNSGGPLPPPPPPSLNPDYVQCPTCNRRFNETAAERHMPFCAEKNKRIPDMKATDPAALRRKDARLNYKTAKPKSKTREPSFSGNTNSYTTGSSFGNDMEINGYGSPMRTGKNERNYQSGLAMRSSSLDRRKNSSEKRQTMPRINSHESMSSRNNDQGMDSGRFYVTPSPPGSGRPPSGSGRPPSGSYRHRVRDIGSGNAKEHSRKTATNTRNMHGDHYNSGGGQYHSVSKFCHDCGYKFCRSEAKYCCECGMRRISL